MPESKKYTFRPIGSGNGIRESSFIREGWKYLIGIFWGLIVIKCLLLQWAAIVYDVPIQMFIYVWVPTWSFVGLTLCFYFYQKKDSLWNAPLEQKVLQGVWSGYHVVGGVLAYMSIYLNKILPFLLPGILSVVLSMVYVGYGVCYRKWDYWGSVVGFLGLGVWMMMRVDVSTLLIFAAGMVVLHVIPMSIRYFYRSSVF